MSRSITLVVWSSRGHLHAALGLARRLERIGRTVRFVGPDRAGAIVTSAGFSFERLEALESLRMPFGVGRRPAAIASDWSVAEMIRKIREGRTEVRRFFEDLPRIRAAMLSLASSRESQTFVFDPFVLIYALPLLSEGVPLVAMSTKPLATPDALVPPYTSRLAPQDPAFRWRVPAAWMRQNLLYKAWELWERLLCGASFRDAAFALAEECGLEGGKIWRTRPILFDTRLRGVEEWVLHAPEFDFPRSTVPNDSRHVGPCVDVYRLEHEPPIDIRGSGPLIFLALSTVQHPWRRSRREQLLRLFVAAAGLRPAWRFLITGGSQADFARTADLPCNVRLVDYVPALRVLPHTNLLVCQAGANMTKEAIWHGVPLLLLPDRADQPGNAARVRHHGVGLVARNASNPTRFVTDCERLMRDPELLARIERMRTIFKGWDADNTALEAALAAAESAARLPLKAW